MQLFQILGTAVLLVVGGYFVYNAMKNSYIQTVFDRRGVAHKRDIRTGKFVKMK